MGVNVSETAKLVGCSREAVVNTYRAWCDKGPETTGGRVPYSILNIQESEAQPGKNTAAETAEAPTEEEEEEETGGADADEMKAAGCTVGKQETGDEVPEQ